MSEHLQPQPDITRFSFWKPEPIPPKNATIVPIELLSLGRLADVAERLMEVPKMAKVQQPPWEASAETGVNLVWEVEQGVILQIKAEQGPPKPGEVLTVTAKAAVPEKVFYRLYVQIFEQFGATVLDEKSHQFFTPKEFRTKLAG
ncbi:MAG TPA: hypothetical protein VEK08_06550 [Planctomycetota bacterium]|nr:hypothetical protein [Planctomycetota bacterium]